MSALCHKCGTQIDEIEERVAFGANVHDTFVVELQEALGQALDILELLGYKVRPGEGFLEKN